MPASGEIESVTALGEPLELPRVAEETPLLPRRAGLLEALKRYVDTPVNAAITLACLALLFVAAKEALAGS